MRSAKATATTPMPIEYRTGTVVAVQSAVTAPYERDRTPESECSFLLFALECSCCRFHCIFVHFFFLSLLVFCAAPRIYDTNLRMRLVACSTCIVCAKWSITTCECTSEMPTTNRRIIKMFSLWLLSAEHFGMTFKRLMRQEKATKERNDGGSTHSK